MKFEGNKLDQRDVEDCREALKDSAMGHMVPVFPELQGFGEDAANGALGEREAFELWHADPQRKVYVGDKASAYKGWQAHAARTAEPVATTVNLIIRDVCEAEPGDPEHADTICIGVEYLRDILERRLERAALTAGKAAQAEPVAWKVDGLNGCNESSPGVWLKKVNADEAAAMLFKSSVTPLYAAPQPAQTAQSASVHNRPETTSEHIARDIREGRFPQHSGWHATLMSWVAKRRLQAMASRPEPIQTELF